MKNAEFPATFKFHRVTKTSHSGNLPTGKDSGRAGITEVANHNHWQRIRNESCDGVVTVDDMPGIPQVVFALYWDPRIAAAGFLALGNHWISASYWMTT